MRTEAKLWFWGLRDIIILAIALTVSVVSWAKLNFMIPAALTLIYGFLSMRLDESSVLSETSIAIKINHLMQLLSEQPDIEIICSDARENFEYNKLSLARKAEKEDNLKVQLLLRRDMKFLDDIQLQMSTAREFMFAYRITHESEDGALATLNRIEKNISDQGFEVKRADKDDIKRFLSRYFGHMTEDAIDDVDGERMIKKWIIPD